LVSRSLAMINKMLGLLGLPVMVSPLLVDGLTNVTVVVAVSVAFLFDRVRLIVKVLGVALVSVAFGSIGLLTTPLVVDQ